MSRETELASPEVVFARPASQATFPGNVTRRPAPGPRGLLLDLQFADRNWEVVLPHSLIPVQIWHGQADADSPISIARYFERMLPLASERTFPSDLKHDLVDEFWLKIFPVSMPTKASLRLVENKTYDNGVVSLQYEKLAIGETITQ